MSKVMSNVLKVGAVAVTSVAFGIYCKHHHKVEKEKKELMEANKEELDELVRSAKTSSYEFREKFNKILKDLTKNYNKTRSLKSAKIALTKEKLVLKKIVKLSEESETALKYYLEDLVLQKEVSNLNRKLTYEQIKTAVYQIAYVWLKTLGGE